MKRSIRYSRNGTTIDENDQVILKNSYVCVIGCGGLGGYSIEMLARAGVGRLKVVDGDCFDPSNLNRQLLCHHDNLNQPKALEAKKRVISINDEIEVEGVSTYIDADNVLSLIEGCDLVIDALDSISVRKVLAKACGVLGIPMVYGAIAGWYGQVATIMPGSTTLDSLYRSDLDRGEEVLLGNPSFTPALTASIQVGEAIKYLTGKGLLLEDGFLHIDMLYNETEKITFT